LRADAAAASKVHNLVYPVPNPAFPFLGVHFTRMIGGGVECGPNAVFSFKREGYRKTDFNLRDSWESLWYPGTWLLFAKHWKYGLVSTGPSRRNACWPTCSAVPSLTLEDFHPSTAGVRAQALGPNGALVDDFQIGPAATRSRAPAPSPRRHGVAAIGDHINQIATERFGL
jgi:L-2-hydroxyglutarate oxidase LhgO